MSETLSYHAVRTANAARESVAAISSFIHVTYTVRYYVVILHRSNIAIELFGSSANIQQWASPVTAGVSWVSRPDQLTRLQTTTT